MSTHDERGHAITDYSDTDYSAFWAGGERRYEDLAERYALRRLTRDFSGCCIEIGGGYGRLLDVYAARCSRVLLTDYAENLLAEARERAAGLGLGQVECAKVNLYELSEIGEKFDCAVCVRVMHHVENVPDFFRQAALSLKEGGVFVLEFANKRNIVEILRFLLGRPNLSPFSRAPGRRGESVYYNFHPAYIREQLKAAGFDTETRLSVSLFRHPLLKRLFPARLLCAVERPLSRILGLYPLSPSVFIRARKTAGK